MHIALIEDEQRAHGMLTLVAPLQQQMVVRLGCRHEIPVNSTREIIHGTDRTPISPGSRTDKEKTKDSTQRRRRNEISLCAKKKRKRGTRRAPLHLTPAPLPRRGANQCVRPYGM